MLDVTGILKELTAEIDYAIAESHKTLDRRDAHNWAKGYRKGLVFARDLLQDRVVIDLTEQAKKADEADNVVRIKQAKGG